MRFFVFLALLGVSASPTFGQLSSKGKGWTINVAYPVFKNRSTTAATANKWARTWEKKVFSEFVAEKNQGLPELQKLGSAAGYELQVTSKVTMDSALVCSALVESYQYTGGAHGNTSYQTINQVAGRRLRLQDLFAKGVNGRREASFAIIEKAMPLPNTSYVQDGSWTELSPEQAENFVITRDGLLFLFGNYELGSYAEGTVDVLIPYANLRGLDRTGPLAKIFAGTPTLTKSTWRLVEVQYNDDRILRPEAGGTYTLYLDGGRVTGIAGRNRITGGYTSKGSSLSLKGLASTRMADPTGSIAPGYLKALGQVQSYFFKDGQLIFQLAYDSGAMIFRR